MNFPLVFRLASLWSAHLSPSADPPSPAGRALHAAREHEEVARGDERGRETSLEQERSGHAARGEHDTVAGVFSRKRAQRRRRNPTSSLHGCGDLRLLILAHTTPTLRRPFSREDSTIYPHRFINTYVQ